MPLKSLLNRMRRPGKGAEKLLGELELAVMRVLWSRDSATVRDVLAVITQDRTLAYTTVKTVMGRLVNKGLLAAEKHGRTHHYRASYTREALEAQAAGQVVQSLITDFGGEIALRQFVQGLAETHPDQLAQLARLASQARDIPHED